MVGDSSDVELRFFVDHNVGKLVRWLRMLGYDSIFFNGPDDGDMVRQAISEKRIILTRDTGIIKRRTVTSGQLRAILLESEVPDEQIKQVMAALDLNTGARPFTRCLECNQLLTPRTREELVDRVPPYVYKTQSQYVECPDCRRIYWRGTHWEAMMRKIKKLTCASNDTAF